MQLSNEIIQLIVYTRRVVEALAKQHNHPWGDYLTGYCGIASRFFISLAERNHIYNMRLVCGTFMDMTHCWVEYNGFCIDITISQFNSFQHKKYKICRLGAPFYTNHYVPEMIGIAAIKRQKQWQQGQAYENCSDKLWCIYQSKYGLNN